MKRPFTVVLTLLLRACIILAAARSPWGQVGLQSEKILRPCGT